MGFKLPALLTSQGYSIYASPSWQANQQAWLATSGINATIDALKGDPSLLAWTVGNEISLGAKSGMTYVTNAAGVGSVRPCVRLLARWETVVLKTLVSRVVRSGRAAATPRGGPTCGRW